MASAEQAPTIRDYLEVLRRRKWLILLFTCLVVAAAIAYTFTRTPIYQSQAQVLVQPFSLETENAATPDDVGLETEALIATSPAVAQVAAKGIGSDDAAALLDNLTVSVAPDTSFLVFLYAHRDPQEAARRAQAFADAYVEYRTDQSQGRIETLASSI